jgi:hypothetical protein
MMEQQSGEGGGDQDYHTSHTVKKRFAVFPSPARMSLTKLSLAGKNLIITGQGE